MARMAAPGRAVGAVRGLLRLSGGRRLRSPIGTSTRPTTARVREAVMNMLASELQDASWPYKYKGLVTHVRSNPYICKVWWLLGRQTLVFVLSGSFLALKPLYL